MSMTREEKMEWMAVWAANAGLRLELVGECGIGRECVGVEANGSYPDYEWSDPETWDRIDDNGKVWTPPAAYHKHPCVAVLGRGEDAEAQLYDWLRWFDEHGFVLETGVQAVDPAMGQLAYIMGRHRYARLVRLKAEVDDGDKEE